MIKKTPKELSMRIDVGGLLKAHTGETRTYEIENWELVISEGAPPEAVNGVVTLLRTHEGILATVHVSLSTREACSRCLREVSLPLQLELEEEFLPTIDIFTGAGLPEPQDPGTFVIDDQQVLDLEEPLRQYRETALPMQPLCRPECAGLCPTCGHDLSLNACACPQEPIDTRWSALAELGRRIGNSRGGH
jgi:uncharacterized protein